MFEKKHYISTHYNKPPSWYMYFHNMHIYSTENTLFSTGIKNYSSLFLEEKKRFNISLLYVQKPYVTDAYKFVYKSRKLPFDTKKG